MFADYREHKNPQPNRFFYQTKITEHLGAKKFSELRAYADCFIPPDWTEVLAISSDAIYFSEKWRTKNPNNHAEVGIRVSLSCLRNGASQSKK